MPSKTVFRQLTEKQCILLYTILQMQKANPPLSATKEKIKAAADFSETEFNRYLHNLRKISQTRYVLSVKGRKPFRYRVSSKRLVTQDDTAQILLLLSGFPFSEDGQIPFQHGIKWISQETRLSEEVIKERIEKAIEQEYLGKIQRNEVYLEITDRVLCELPFLKMVAQDFVKPRNKPLN